MMPLSMILFKKYEIIQKNYFRTTNITNSNDIVFIIIFIYVYITNKNETVFLSEINININILLISIIFRCDWCRDKHP